MDYNEITTVQEETQELNHFNFDYTEALSSSGVYTRTYSFTAHKGDQTYSFGQLMVKDLKRLLKLYNQLVENLFKAKDFLELTIENLTEQISDDDFAKELEEHPEKYMKTISPKKTTYEDIKLIVDILCSVKKDKELSVDDVSELFSMDLSEAENVIETANNELLKCKND